MMNTLICANETDTPGSFCLFVTGPRMNIGSAWPVAWRVARVPGRGRARLQWADDEGAAWAQTGRVGPGTNFFAVQTVPAPRFADSGACRPPIPI